MPLPVGPVLVLEEALDRIALLIRDGAADAWEHNLAAAHRIVILRLRPASCLGREENRLRVVHKTPFAAAKRKDVPSWDVIGKHRNLACVIMAIGKCRSSSNIFKKCFNLSKAKIFFSFLSFSEKELNFFIYDIGVLSRRGKSPELFLSRILLVE